MKILPLILFLFLFSSNQCSAQIDLLFGNWKLVDYSKEDGTKWNFWKTENNLKPGDYFDSSKIQFKRKKVILKDGKYETKTSFKFADKNLEIQGNSKTYIYEVSKLDNKVLILKYVGPETNNEILYIHYKKVD